MFIGSCNSISLHYVNTSAMLHVTLVTNSVAFYEVKHFVVMHHVEAILFKIRSDLSSGLICNTCQLSHGQCMGNCGFREEHDLWSV